MIVYVKSDATKRNYMAYVTMMHMQIALWLQEHVVDHYTLERLDSKFLIVEFSGIGQEEDITAFKLKFCL